MTAKQDAIADILDAWRMIDRVIHARYHELAQANDLTLEQFHLLLQLEEHQLEMTSGAPTIGQIADAAGNAPHTLTDRIKRLEKKGLVKKTRDDRDQRICRITVTPAGHRLITKIVTTGGGDFIRAALERMKGTELTALNGALELFRRQLAAAAGLDSEELANLHPLLGIKRH